MAFVFIVFFSQFNFCRKTPAISSTIPETAKLAECVADARALLQKILSSQQPRISPSRRQAWVRQADVPQYIDFVDGIIKYVTMPLSR